MDDRLIDDELAIVSERTAESEGPVLDQRALSEPTHRLCPRPPLAVPLGAPLADAVRLMRENRVGCVLVVDGAYLAGIVTERDLLMKLQGADLERRVDDLMTPAPETLHPDDPIAFALNLMSDGGFRHVPLVDAQSRPVGIVSVKDVVNYLADFFPKTVHTVPPNLSRADMWRTRYGA
jgi:CBS domain-containing protein